MGRGGRGTKNDGGTYMAFRLSLGALGTPGALLLVALGLTLGSAAPAAAQLSFGPTVNVSSNGGFSRQPHIVIDASGVLHVAWADDTGAANTRILYSRSFDQGASFTAPVVISTGAGAALRPRLATQGGSVHLVWMQDDATAKEIMFSRSVDGGQSFSSPVNLSQTAGESQEGRVAAAPNGSVFVVWDEASPSRHIAMRRSLNGGADFEAQSTIVPVLMTGSSDPNAPTGARTPYPGVAVDPGSGNVYLVWHDRVGADLQVRFSRSTDNGASFSTPLNVSGAAIHAHCAAISVGPTGTVLLAWENRKQITPHTHDAYVSHSTDGGLSFTSPVNLSNGPSWALSDYPWAVQGPSGMVVVGWEDNTTSGNLEAVIKVSTDGGFTFGPLTNLSNTSTTSTEIVTLFGPDGALYVIWEEQQNPTGPGEILLRRAGGSGGTLFVDVPVGYWARPWIEALSRAGVTGGCVMSPPQYCPAGAVSRAQMAIFLLKARHGAGFTPPAATGMFGDVPPGYWAAAWIEELVRQGITAGCGAGNYCPEGAVTRAQMAIFLLKALDPGLSPPPPTGIFSDVPPGYWAAAWIEELVRRAIAAGCGNGQFCPDAAVSRAEMAVLLVNTFDIPM
jgi:hypothetical protein